MRYLAILLIVFTMLGAYLGIKSSKNKNVNSPAPEVKAEIAQNTIKSVPPPAASSTATEAQPDNSKQKEIIEYAVQSGDTLSLIASKFKISINTILSANSLTVESVLQPGMKLKILPVSGIEYLVKKDDTVSKIASAYGIEAQKIIDANNLNANARLKIGQSLLLPGTTQIVKSSPAPQTISKLAISKTTTKSNAPTSIKPTGKITWTSGALKELNRAPSFIRPSIKTKINNYAVSHGIKTITAEIYNSIKI